MKRSKRGLSKKGLVGLQRVWKAKDDGSRERVWMYKGQEHKTLRSVVIVNRLELMGLLEKKDEKKVE